MLSVIAGGNRQLSVVFIVFNVFRSQSVSNLGKHELRSLGRADSHSAPEGRASLMDPRWSQWGQRDPHSA